MSNFLNKYRTKWRIARKDRLWNGSVRKKEIDAERDLPPRPLKSDEDKLLRWILEHGSEEARSFLPQVEGIRAVRACTCGCPTIRLEVSEGTPLGRALRGRLICDLLGRTAKGELVGVLLFQDDGRICELEAYSVDGLIQSDSNEYSFPIIESLRELSAGEPPAEAHS